MNISKVSDKSVLLVGSSLPCRWHESHIIVMEEVVISGPGYDPASTNVPGYTQEQLQSFIDATNTGPVPEGAQSKANSWQRVTKVVSNWLHAHGFTLSRHCTDSSNLSLWVL